MTRPGEHGKSVEGCPKHPPFFVLMRDTSQNGQIKAPILIADLPIFGQLHFAPLARPPSYYDDVHHAATGPPHTIKLARRVH